ncbi:MAG: molybdopterin converting factor subunit 1 [Acetobacteraceae bacterium]|nr:molybdopterin converting factor subunit 1 [Acetobacteraceae bacterium]
MPETTRTLHILYFAWLRERVGRSEEELDVPDRVRTVADLIEHLASRDVAHETAFQNRRTVRCAVNQEFAHPLTELQTGDEVAFFPPVTGG